MQQDYISNKSTSSDIKALTRTLPQE